MYRLNLNKSKTLMLVREYAHLNLRMKDCYSCHAVSHSCFWFRFDYNGCVWEAFAGPSAHDALALIIENLDSGENTFYYPDTKFLLDNKIIKKVS